MTQRHQNFWRQVTRDVVMALGVLALVFLSFGHQPIALAADSAPYVFPNGDLASFCGNAPQSGQAHGKGCDACRLTSGIALPNSPTVPVARFTLVKACADISSNGFVPAGVLNRVQDPRAPPFV